jgi:hypothetical protein
VWLGRACCDIGFTPQYEYLFYMRAGYPYHLAIKYLLLLLREGRKERERERQNFALSTEHS